MRQMLSDCLVRVFGSERLFVGVVSSKVCYGQQCADRGSGYA